MSDRGMKKWAPYASLIEQKGIISRMKNHRQQVKKPLISQEMAAEINACLLIANNQHVNIDYFFQGNKIQLSGLITKINYDEKWLVINNETFAFAGILSIRLR